MTSGSQQVVVAAAAAAAVINSIFWRDPSNDPSTIVVHSRVLSDVRSSGVADISDSEKREREEEEI